jgi:thiamine-phosphate pyrophosphorylase
LPPLYTILDVDVAAAAGWTLVDLAAACLNGGSRFLQIRAKHAPGGWLLDVTSAIVERARAADGVVIVNDRADIARLANAHGVHVGQDDLSAAAARTLVGAAAVVGLSTHTLEQVEAALAQPISYVAVGPVFDTSTKATGYAAIGLDRVRAAADRTRSRTLPLVAIGGITLETARQVIRAGAASVAVISDLLSGGDPEGQVRAYIERLSP